MLDTKWPARSNRSMTPSGGLLTTRPLPSGVGATAAGAPRPWAPAATSWVAVIPLARVAGPARVPAVVGRRRQGSARRGAGRERAAEVPDAGSGGAGDGDVDGAASVGGQAARAGQSGRDRAVGGAGGGERREPLDQLAGRSARAGPDDGGEQPTVGEERAAVGGGGSRGGRDRRVHAPEPGDTVRADVVAGELVEPEAGGGRRPAMSWMALGDDEAPGSIGKEADLAVRLAPVGRGAGGDHPLAVEGWVGGVGVDVAADRHEHDGVLSRLRGRSGGGRARRGRDGRRRGRVAGRARAAGDQRGDDGGPGNSEGAGRRGSAGAGHVEVSVGNRHESWGKREDRPILAR